MPVCQALRLVEKALRLAAGSRMRALASGFGAQVLDEAAFRPTARMREGLFVFRLRLPPEMTLEQAAHALQGQPGVVWVARNARIPLEQTPVTPAAAVFSGRVAAVSSPGGRVFPQGAGPGGLPNDPAFGEQWSLHNTGQTFKGGTLHATAGADIDAPEAWELEVGSSEDPVVVAVIDTGVQFDHPDLAANMWRNPGEVPDNGIDDDGNGYIDDVYGWDFYKGDATVYDPGADNPHGTHVAGTIAAVTNNGLGTAGVAWNARIMALKVFGPSGYLFIALERSTILSRPWLTPPTCGRATACGCSPTTAGGIPLTSPTSPVRSRTPSTHPTCCLWQPRETLPPTTTQTPTTRPPSGFPASYRWLPPTGTTTWPAFPTSGRQASTSLRREARS